ncbi:PREDICTED: zinc finger protein ZAT5 [Tarenaya hassleriana]|uniref:zinc finger protein ZAT5 n=1 Tax=Tarenaya hassleriana TaxID=28532 RepID=UPI00053C6D9D|nr:PREDICTED: zinc finger protein ZAT5 [Tarenaya hassleriana]
MDAHDEFRTDRTHYIIKGKRTKRQRSYLPFVPSAAAATVTTVTSTSSSAGGGGGGALSDENGSAVSSPVTSTIFSSAMADCTEEEEDMAICLIMLARGAGPPPVEKIGKPEKIHKNSEKTHHENSGFHVYECKTCNRTFPSFQALGGHRASHKRPRTDEKTKSPLEKAKPRPSEEGQNCQTKIAGENSAPPENNNSNKPNKVHECSICGSEFTSGQALGGHMRRHRTATSAGEGGNNPVVASRGNTEVTGNVDRLIEPRKYLPLDLNLPAPEDDLRESKFQGLVLSATPALVDCHY